MSDGKWLFCSDRSSFRKIVSKYNYTDNEPLGFPCMINIAESKEGVKVRVKLLKHFTEAVGFLQGNELMKFLSHDPEQRKEK